MFKIEAKRMSKYLNLESRIYTGSGKYNIPIIKPVFEVNIDSWVGFNYVMSTKTDTSEKGVHFFLDDYQFERVWNAPDRYINILEKYGAVLSPDFSLYVDFPKAIQIYNHYRKHWLAAYWQERGITVIPTVAWSDENSFDWCFDGEPINSIVAISSVSTQNSGEAKESFLKGYNKMLDFLTPAKIIFFGKVPDECNGNIVHVPAFQDKFKNTVKA